MGGLSAVTLGKHRVPEWDSFSIAFGAKPPMSGLPVLHSSGWRVADRLVVRTVLGAVPLWFLRVRVLQDWGRRLGQTESLMNSKGTFRLFPWFLEKRRRRARS